jgi:small subunit ribosomal protein S20
MANTRSAAKRARQTLTRTLRNKAVLTRIKSQQKCYQSALAAGDQAQAARELAVLSSRLDKAAKIGVIHGNLANRQKSRAAAGLNKKEKAQSGS